MTIIETDGRTHGVAAYEVNVAEPEEGIRFVADCGMEVDYPYDGVASVLIARVDCDDCIAARLDAIRLDQSDR